MMKKFLVVAQLLCVSCTAFSQNMLAEGVFSSNAVSLRTIILDPENGTVAASATVTAGACSGSVAGIGRLSGKTLTFTSYKKIESGNVCAITVEFDSAWKRAKIIEGENCLPYHGAACGWEGQVATKR